MHLRTCSGNVNIIKMHQVYVIPRLLYGLDVLFVDRHIRSLLTYIRVFNFLLLSYTPPASIRAR